MTRILSILLLLCALPALAIDRITATITVTNTPSDGNTLTVNGDIRTLKTTVATPATQIALTNVAGWQATNIFQQQAAYLYAGPLTLSYSSTNGVKLTANSGNALVVTASGTWCSIVMSTQTVTSMTGVRVPISGEPTASTRTNIASLLAQAMSDYSTTSIAASSLFGANFLNLTLDQTISGTKTFSGPNTYSNAAQVFVGGWATNVGLINIPTLSGTLGNLTNGTFTNPSFTNGQNFGNPFRSPGPATLSEQFGTLAVASGNYSVAFGVGATALGVGCVSLGDVAISANTSSTAIGFDARAIGFASIAIGESTKASNYNSIAIGDSSVSTNDYSIAIGSTVTTTADHQIRLGTSSESTSIPGNLQVDGSISNATFSGGVILQNKIAFPKKSITTLVNSPSVNLVATSTNTLLRLTGPTGAFSVGSFDGGTDGRILIVLNTTGQAMTVVNESGATGTAADRILTNTGADVAISGSQQMVMFIYDILAARWILGPKN